MSKQTQQIPVRPLFSSLTDFLASLLVSSGMLFFALGMSASAQAAPPQLGIYRYGDAGTNVDRGMIPYSKWLGTDVTLGEDFTDYTQGWANAQGPSWAFENWQKWVQARPGRNVVQSYPILPAVDGSRTLPDGSTVSWAECAAGKYDQYFANYARGLMNYGLEGAYIRLAWEFDGNWYAWAVRNGEEADFVSCWRETVKTLRQAAPGNQFKFVWNVDTFYYTDRGGMPWLTTTYPGDDVVDVIAIEFYDNTWDTLAYPYPSGCDATCRQARQDRAWNTDNFPAVSKLLDFSKAHGKPFGFGEWGVTDRLDGSTQRGGMDDPSFIQKMHDLITDPANNVAFHIYFDVASGDGNHRLADFDGPIEFPDSAALFKNLFGSRIEAPLTGGSSGVSTIPIPASGRTDFNMVVPSATKDSNSWRLLAPGGYMEFTVFTAAAGTYDVVLGDRTTDDSPVMSMSVNGLVQSTVKLPNTGDWNKVATTPSGLLTLPSGRSVVRFTNAGSSWYALESISLTPRFIATAATSSLTAEHSGFCVKAAGMSIGSGFIQSNCDGSAQEVFQFTPASQGRYRIQPLSSPDLCLDYQLGGVRWADAVLLATCSGASTQEWTMRRTWDGSFIIGRSDEQGCLDVLGVSKDSGAMVDTWYFGTNATSQFFRADALSALVATPLTPVPMPSPLPPSDPWDGKTTTLQVEKSKLCLQALSGIGAAGSTLVQHSCSSLDAQLSISAVGDGTYWIHPLNDATLCVDAGPGGISWNNLVKENSCNTASVSQKWKISRAWDGSFVFQRADGLGCLDLQGPSFADGSPFQTWYCGPGATNQMFRASGF